MSKNGETERRKGEKRSGPKRMTCANQSNGMRLKTENTLYN